MGVIFTRSKGLRQAAERLTTVKKNLLELAGGIRAWGWTILYGARHWTGHLAARSLKWLPTAIIAAAVVGSALVTSQFSPQVEFLGKSDHLPELQQVFVALGGALVGATAIAFSLIMFAMQINVDRMPYGLFRRFSFDGRLLLSFVGTFLLGIFIAALSLNSNVKFIGTSLLLAAWSMVVVLILFVSAYRRALSLISPYEQLRIIEESARASLDSWGKRIRRIAPSHTGLSPFDEAGRSLWRLDTLFDNHPEWTDKAVQAIEYVFAYAKRFAERGDHEVASSSLAALIRINGHYIENRGATFTYSNTNHDILKTDDRVFNLTLEQLSQAANSGFARGDARQVEDVFRTFEELTCCQLRIQYLSSGAMYSYAQITAGYLANSVAKAATFDMPDALIVGLRCLSTVAQLLAQGGQAHSMLPLLDKFFAAVVLNIGDMNRVTVALAGVDELSTLTLFLICTGSHAGRRPAIEDVRSKLFEIAHLAVECLPDTAERVNHKTVLDPYFSSFGPLIRNLRQVAWNLSAGHVDDATAAPIVAEMKTWARGLGEAAKTLMEVAVRKKSSLISPLLRWVESIFEILLEVSKCRACERYQRVELLEAASSLIATITIVLPDRDTFVQVQTQPVDGLFRICALSGTMGCAEVSAPAYAGILEWLVTVGSIDTFWNPLEYCAVVLAAVCSIDIVPLSRLTADLRNQLARNDAPSATLRSKAAAALRRRINETDSLFKNVYVVEHELRKDHAVTLKIAIGEIADMLSPLPPRPVKEFPFF